MELALVTVAGDYRPVLIHDLTDGTRHKRRRGTLRVTQDPEDDSKGTVSGQWVIHAQDATELSTLIDTFVRRIERPGRHEHVEWKPPPATKAGYFPRLGPGTAQVVTTAYHHALYRRAVIDVSIPVEMPIRGLCMDVADDFEADSTSDFTFDALTSASVTIAGKVNPNGSLGTERRARHTARGYPVLEGQATLKFTPGTTVTSFKAGRTLRASSATTYVECYVDDNGTNSRLRIDVVLAGVRTNRATVNLSARVATGTAYYVRGRIEGNVVYAEFFTSDPTPMGAPTTQSPSGGAGYTLTGGEIAALVPGCFGFSWTPQSSDSWLDDYRDRPYTYRNRTLPEKLSPSDAIPGSDLALIDYELTPSGGSAAPVWALLAWNRRPSAPLSGAVAPFGIISGGSAGDLAGWASTTHADALNASIALDATPTSAETYTASWIIDPSTLDPDELQARELALEVWARVALDSSLVTPRLTLSARPEAGLDFGPERFTREHRSAGQLLTVPTADAWRPVRLGTLIIPVDPREPVKWKLWLAGSLGAGSAGSLWGIDYLWVDVANRRVRSPVGLALDSTFPKFVKSTSQTRKRALSDGRGAVASPPNPLFPDVGLGGSGSEMSPGTVDVLAKLSSLVPGDPTLNTSTEQKSHAATVHLRVIPRYSELRGS